MDKTRYYELRKGWQAKAEIIRWGLSRFGKAHDQEMQDAVAGQKTAGDGTAFCVGFTPERRRIAKPEQVQAHRIRNMQKRVSKFPLFAEQFEKQEMQRSYFSLEEANQSQRERLENDQKWEKDFWARLPLELEVRLPNAPADLPAVAGMVRRDVGNLL
jgi:hypothetical protein